MKKFLMLLACLVFNSHTFSKLDQGKAFNYDAWLRTFGEVINLFESRYYKDLDPEKAMAEAIKGYSQQDPHTGFLDRKSCKDLHEKMSGEFYGIGIVLPGDKKKEEDFFPIIETVPGGPADKAGIKQGDKVIQVDETLVKGLEIDELMPLLRGEKNSKVILKVLREKYPETISFTVHRDVIKDEMALGYHFKKYNIYYLLLSIFSEKSSHNVEAIIEKAASNNARGVIIDLRNNTGGLFDVAIDIAGLFLPKGTPVVSIRNRAGETTSKWETKRKPLKLSQKMPIFILVNNYTASASEILAGVLQLYAHHKNLVSVFVVGDETFGKGSVQEVIPVSNESAIKLTTGLYFLPFDTSIQGKGVTPDFIIDHRLPPTETMKWVTKSYGKESALKGSIKPHNHKEKEDKSDLEKKKEDDKKPWKQRRKELLSQDYFIQNTVNLINLYNLGIKAEPKNFATHSDTLQFLHDNFVLDTKLEAQEIKVQ